MAKTKAKRRRKHRGTQAGTVRQSPEARGRDSGRSAATRSRADAREDARRRRVERLDRPPTWRGSLNRAAIAAGLVAVVAVLVLRNTVPQAIVLAVLMLVIYVPLGYLFDTFLYRLRQRRKGGGGGSPRDGSTGAAAGDRPGRGGR